MKKEGKNLDVQLASSSKDGKKIYGIHSEVLESLNIPNFVQKQIAQVKTNEDKISKPIHLNLPDNAIEALIEFAYTGEIDDNYLETLQEYGLQCLYNKWRENQNKPLYNYVLAISGWVVSGPADNIEVLNTATGEWKKMKCLLGTNRAYHGSGIVNNILYVFGGYEKDEETENGDYRQDLFAFNSTTKEWDNMANMQNKRCYVSSAVLNGDLYAIGGYNGIQRHKTVERYDPILNSWNTVAPMNHIRSDGCAVGYESTNTIYAIGGFNGEDIHDSVEIYYPTRNQWVLGPRMNVPRTGVKAVVYHNKIYAIGGFDGAERLKTVEVLDPHGDNEWKFVNEMHVTRSNHAATVYDDKILVMGGFQGNGINNMTEVYADKTDTWKMFKSMKHERSALASVTLENQSMDFDTFTSK